MDPRSQTSFIPKKPIIASSSGIPRTINLLALIATVLFVVSLALSGGAFFYQDLINKQITADKASLDRAKGAFEPDLINQIIRLDTRIEVSKQLLASHLSITPFFDYLSSVTLKSIRFKDFNFSYLAPDKIQVSMKGQGASYTSVALESDLLDAQKYLSNTAITDMSLDPTGTVSFNVSTTLDQSLVLYGNEISKGSISNSSASTTPNQ